MTKIFAWCATFMGLAVGLGMAAPAHAQTLQAGFAVLAQNNTLTFDGLQITVASCLYNDGTTGRASSCTSSDNLFLAPVSGPNPEVIIEAATSATVGSALVPIFSYSCPATGACLPSGATPTYDLSVYLNVQSETKTKILDVGQVLTGSASSDITSTYPTDVHLGEGVTNSSGSTLCTETLNLSNATTVCPSFTPVRYLTVSKDMGLLLNGVTNGSTLSLVSVAQVFTPEPASFALLLSGLGALGVARRRRRAGKGIAAPSGRGLVD